MIVVTLEDHTSFLVIGGLLQVDEATLTDPQLALLVEVEDVALCLTSHAA